MLFFYSCLSLFLSINLVNAQTNQGVYFEDEDWHIVCDNTLTCRAVGFDHQEPTRELDSRISILLVRKAGANQSLSGYVRIKDDEIEQLSDTPITVAVNNQVLGTVKTDDEPYELRPKQISSIISALKSNDKTVSFQQNNNTWRISNAGFNAVMLKMDEVQGRIGTIGAIIKTGNKDESHVYPSIPAPIIKKAAVISPKHSQKLTLDEVIRRFPDFETHYKNEADCQLDLSQSAEETYKPTFQLFALNKDNDLLAASCLLGVYNFGEAYWVIPKGTSANKNEIKFVTRWGTDYSDGKISEIQKTRGIGDCWSRIYWTWNGQQFLRSSDITTGPCRGFDDGTWELPYFVSEIE